MYFVKGQTIQNIFSSSTGQNRDLFLVSDVLCQNPHCVLPTISYSERPRLAEISWKKMSVLCALKSHVSIINVFRFIALPMYGYNN